MADPSQIGGGGNLPQQQPESGAENTSQDPAGIAAESRILRIEQLIVDLANRVDLLGHQASGAVQDLGQQVQQAQSTAQAAATAATTAATTANAACNGKLVLP